MKTFGSTLYFVDRRNRDLLRAFRTVLLNNDGISSFELVCHHIANSPASRFWVSEERAGVVIKAMLAGKPLIKMRPNKKEMFAEIFRRFVSLREQYPAKQFDDLIIEVVNQPAPSFYLTPKTVKEYLYKIKNGWYENKKS
ncbi:MAG: hypothetical protein HDS31_04150 [Bacteroides sp.]|nr:hypothetical protein [Bacteroides sp.]